jgi:hypothetical protein
MQKDTDIGWRMKISDALSREASQFMTGEPRVRGISLGRDVTFSEKAGETIKAMIPFGKGRLRPDFVVFNRLPMTTGAMHIVHAYSGDAILPVEFVFTRAGRIPRAVCLKRGGMLGGGRWTSESGEEGKGSDKLCDHLAAGGLKRWIEWDLRLGSRLRIPLQWAVQLVPLKGDRYAFIIRVPCREGFLGGFKHNLRSVLAYADKIDQAVRAFAYQGQSGRPQPLIQSFGVLAISGLGGQDIYMDAGRQEAPTESRKRSDAEADAGVIATQRATANTGADHATARHGVALTKSYVGRALLALALYYLGCFVGGLASNIYFLVKANQDSRSFGQSAPGRGCLVALLAVHVGLACLMLLLFVVHVVRAS